MGVSNASSKERTTREGGARERELTPAMLLSRSEDGSLDFNSSLVLILLAEQAEHVGDEENQQYCPQTYAGPSTRTPAGMAVVPSTEAKNQY
jgi:hypothetical protein